ncbi:MAG: heme exporter protein CcmD [Proteobacteria bacterium]|nr:heme exporter protein CcmD [Pseudomonadota bacterium]
MSAFIHMGGYAAYVWPAYAVTLAVIALNIIGARRLLRRSIARARRRLAVAGEGAR